MKGYYTLLIGMMTCFCLHAQREYPIKIQDFSEDFRAEITKEAEDNYYITVFNKKNDKKLIIASTTDFPDYLLDENKQAIPNIQELPYGDQSILLYEDYNFDGIKDFALMNGYNGCYGGASFDIYLAKNELFNYSEDLSVLSNGNCSFYADHEKKRLYTMTKSGCCWHQYSEYKVVNNRPVPVKIIEEKVSFMEPTLSIFYTQEWINGTLQEKTQKYFIEGNINSLFSFELEKSGKKVIFFKENNILYYALQLPDESIEFHYPDPVYNKQTEQMEYGEFMFSKKTGILRFTNKNALYEIHDSKDKTGIKVTVNSKVYEMNGKENTRIHSLESLHSYDLKNVHYEQ